MSASGNAAVNSRVTVFQFTDTANVLQTLHCSMDGVTYGRKRTIAKVENFCTVDKSPGNVDVTITVDGEWVSGSSDIDAVFNGLIYDGLARLYKYGPGGSSTGMVMYSGISFCTDYTIKAKTGSLVLVTASFEGVGNDSRAVW